jgi:hypothetical protein
MESQKDGKKACSLAGCRTDQSPGSARPGATWKSIVEIPVVVFAREQVTGFPHGHQREQANGDNGHHHRGLVIGRLTGHLLDVLGGEERIMGHVTGHT